MRCDGEPVRLGMRTTRRMTRASKPGKQNGTLSADTIRASGLVRPHRQAGHKSAPDHNAKTTNQPLQCGSHPHRSLVKLRENAYRSKLWSGLRHADDDGKCVTVFAQSRHHDSACEIVGANGSEIKSGSRLICVPGVVLAGLSRLVKNVKYAKLSV
jgi:hypothetical protein